MANRGKDVAFVGKICSWCGVDMSNQRLTVALGLMGAFLGGRSGFAVGGIGGALIGGLLGMAAGVVGSMVFNASISQSGEATAGKPKRRRGRFRKPGQDGAPAKSPRKSRRRPGAGK